MNCSFHNVTLYFKNGKNQRIIILRVLSTLPFAKEKTEITDFYQSAVAYTSA